MQVEITLLEKTCYSKLRRNITIDVRTQEQSSRQNSSISKKGRTFRSSLIGKLSEGILLLDRRGAILNRRGDWFTTRWEKSAESFDEPVVAVSVTERRNDSRRAICPGGGENDLRARLREVDARARWKLTADGIDTGCPALFPRGMENAMDVDRNRG